jgi:hypothetical protein
VSCLQIGNFSAGAPNFGTPQDNGVLGTHTLWNSMSCTNHLGMVGCGHLNAKEVVFWPRSMSSRQENATNSRGRPGRVRRLRSRRRAPGYMHPSRPAGLAGTRLASSYRRRRSPSVRFFTPQQEIAACGHVTISIATALVELDIWSWGREVTVRSAGGEFPLHLRDGQVEMDQRQQFAARAAVSWTDVIAALGQREQRRRLIRL